MLTRSGTAFFLLSVLCFISACAWMRPAAPQLPVMNNAEGMKSLVATQTVVVEATNETTSQNSNETHKFLVQIEIANEEFHMVALSQLGQKLFSIYSEAGKLNIHKSDWLPEQVSVTQIVALMQFVYWPQVRLEALYSKQPENYRIDVRESGKVLFRNNKEAVLAKYSTKERAWPNDVSLKIPAANVHIQINTAELEYL